VPVAGQAGSRRAVARIVVLATLPRAEPSRAGPRQAGGQTDSGAVAERSCQRLAKRTARAAVRLALGSLMMAFMTMTLMC
jgi:hypothetical protein